MKNTVRPTLKQKRFVKELIVNKAPSMQQAALKSGYSPNTARNVSKDILGKPGVNQLIQKHMGGEDWVITAKGELLRIMTKGRRDADRLKSIDIWSNLVGAKAPQQMDITAYSGGDRAAFYENTIKEVKAMVSPPSEKEKLEISEPAKAQQE